VVGVIYILKDSDHLRGVNEDRRLVNNRGEGHTLLMHKSDAAAVWIKYHQAISACQ